MEGWSGEKSYFPMTYSTADRNFHPTPDTGAHDSAVKMMMITMMTELP
jgi:hypothetical protein